MTLVSDTAGTGWHEGSGMMSQPRGPVGNESGFTVVEFMVAAVILFFVATSVMGALAYASTASAGTAMREGALQLANQRMEQSRNTSFTVLGTVNGWPQGSIPDEQDVGDYHVHTLIEYEPPPAGSTSELSTSKRITITVSWTAVRGGNVTVESNITGILVGNFGDVKVSVVDATTNQKILVASSITVTPLNTSPKTKTTDSTGAVWWGKMPSGAIRIAGTAPGYYLDVAPLSAASVLANQLNPWVIKAYKMSTVTVKIQRPSPTLAAVATATVTMKGGLSGSTTQTGTTDANGYVTFFASTFETPYTVSWSKTGFISGSSSLVVAAGGNPISVTYAMTKKATLTVTVKDQHSNPVPGATLTMNPALSMTDNGDGTYLGYPTLGQSYTVVAAKVGYVTSPVSSPTGAIVAEQDAALSSTVLRKITLTVTVRDRGENLVSGATINTTPSLPMTANGVGTYLGYPTVGQNYTVSASKTGYFSPSAAKSTGVIITDQDTAMELTLERKPTLTITVKNSAGGLLSGATLAISPTLTYVDNGNGTYTTANPTVGQIYTVTASKSGFTSPSAPVSTDAIGVEQDATLLVTLLRKPTLTVTVRDQTNRLVSGATLAISPTLTYVDNGNGTYTTANPTVGQSYTVTASKTPGYTSPSAPVSTGAIGVEQDAALSLPVTRTYGILIVNFTFRTTDSVGASYTIHVYNATTHAEITGASFTVTKPASGVLYTTERLLPPGFYSLSRNAPWSTSVAVPVPAELTAGGTATVTMTRSN